MLLSKHRSIQIISLLFIGLVDMPTTVDGVPVLFCSMVYVLLNLLNVLKIWGFG
jgi:hypothetical protein